MKNKILLIIFICFFLCGCGNYRELNDMAIITVAAIDKKDDNYELSFLVANAKNGQNTSRDGEAWTTIYSGIGKTLTQAAESLDFKTPKKLYLGHINMVIISDKVAKEGFLKIADFLMRYPETRKQFYLIQTKNKPKDILKIVSPLESFPSQGIASLLEFNKEAESVNPATYYTDFLIDILKPGKDPIIPVIKIVGNDNKATSLESLQSTSPSAYLKLDSIALYHNDKFKNYMNFSDSLMVNIINNDVSELKTIFKYNNNDIGISSKNIKSTLKVSKNNAYIQIKGTTSLLESNNKINFNNKKTYKNLEYNLNKSFENRCYKTIKKLQDNKTDSLGFGNLIYRKNTNNWNKISNLWYKKYFPNLKIKCESNVKINSLGSLNKSIGDNNDK